MSRHSIKNRDYNVGVQSWAFVPLALLLLLGQLLPHNILSICMGIAALVMGVVIYLKKGRWETPLVVAITLALLSFGLTEDDLALHRTCAWGVALSTGTIVLIWRERCDYEFRYMAKVYLPILTLYLLSTHLFSAISPLLLPLLLLAITLYEYIRVGWANRLLQKEIRLTTVDLNTDGEANHSILQIRCLILYRNSLLLGRNGWSGEKLDTPSVVDKAYPEPIDRALHRAVFPYVAQGDYTTTAIRKSLYHYPQGVDRVVLLYVVRTKTQPTMKQRERLWSFKQITDCAESALFPPCLMEEIKLIYTPLTSIK